MRERFFCRRLFVCLILIHDFDGKKCLFVVFIKNLNAEEEEKEFVISSKVVRTLNTHDV